MSLNSSEIRAEAASRVVSDLRSIRAMPGAADYRYQFFGDRMVIALEDMAPAEVEWGVRKTWDDDEPTTWRGDDAEDLARAHLEKHGGELVRRYVCEWNEVWS